MGKARTRASVPSLMILTIDEGWPLPRVIQGLNQKRLQVLDDFLLIFIFEMNGVIIHGGYAPIFQ